MKLTKAQRDVLKRKKEGCYPNYLIPAVKQLISMKLLEYDEDDAPGTVKFTEAGRKALETL